MSVARNNECAAPSYWAQCGVAVNTVGSRAAAPASQGSHDSDVQCSPKQEDGKLLCSHLRRCCLCLCKKTTRGKGDPLVCCGDVGRGGSERGAQAYADASSHGATRLLGLFVTGNMNEDSMCTPNAQQSNKQLEQIAHLF